MTISTLNHSTTIYFLLMLALFCATQGEGFVPAVPSHAPRITTLTQLSMAWSLPAPIQGALSSNTYWYTDCGTCVDRHIEYNEDYFDLQDAAADGLGLGFARLSQYETSLAYSDNDQEDDAETTGDSFPIRVLRGVWNRVRGTIDE